MFLVSLLLLEVDIFSCIFISLEQVIVDICFLLVFGNCFFNTNSFEVAN